MLSRLAESLFWMGRYLERAGATARLVEAQLHQALEDPVTDELEVARGVLSVMGMAVPLLPVTLEEVTARLVFDRNEPSSIASSLAAARENARGAREMIPSELWECLNTADASARRRAATEPPGPHTYFHFCRFVRDRVALADGIADAAMARDHGWRFLALGRNLERVDMTARLLAVRSSLARTSSDWATTLRCCSAHESYLRTHRSTVTAERVLAYLLRDELFPRSVLSALRAAANVAAALDAEHGRRGHEDHALAALGGAASHLESASLGALLEDLPELLAGLGRAGSEASRALASRYFGQHALLPSWRSGALHSGIDETELAR